MELYDKHFRCMEVNPGTELTRQFEKHLFIRSSLQLFIIQLENLFSLNLSF